MRSYLTSHSCPVLFCFCNQFNILLPAYMAEMGVLPRILSQVDSHFDHFVFSMEGDGFIAFPYLKASLHSSVFVHSQRSKRIVQVDFKRNCLMGTISGSCSMVSREAPAKNRMSQGRFFTLAMFSCNLSSVVRGGLVLGIASTVVNPLPVLPCIRKRNPPSAHPLVLADEHVDRLIPAAE